jgi:hypothetical protein
MAFFKGLLGNRLRCGAPSIDNTRTSEERQKGEAIRQEITVQARAEPGQLRAIISSFGDAGIKRAGGWRVWSSLGTFESVSVGALPGPGMSHSVVQLGDDARRH